jgi:hypothetical protein
VTMARGTEAFLGFWVLLPPRLQCNLVVNWLCEPLRNKMRKRLSYLHSSGNKKGERRSNHKGAGVVVESSVFRKVHIAITPISQRSRWVMWRGWH